MPGSSMGLLAAKIRRSSSQLTLRLSVKKLSSALRQLRVDGPMVFIKLVLDLERLDNAS